MLLSCTKGAQMPPLSYKTQIFPPKYIKMLQSICKYQIFFVPLQTKTLNLFVMPEISRFYGIIICLYWKDHNPPHVHFTYGDYECSISVLDRIVDGQAPAKVISKVNLWIDLHEQEILSMWESAQEGKQIGRIDPLK